MVIGSGGEEIAGMLDVFLARKWEKNLAEFKVLITLVKVLGV